MRQLDRLKSAQLEINVMAHIAKANPLERLGMFKLAFEALDNGERIVIENYGKMHPLITDFKQVREMVKEQYDYSKG